MNKNSYSGKSNLALAGKNFVFAIVLVLSGGLTREAQAQIITTVAGTGILGFSGDGGAAIAAELHFPTGVAADLSGNIYIVDTDNQRVRKVTSSGIISTNAGNGGIGYTGDGGAATSAWLNYPGAIAVDAAGNIYIGDGSNNCVRKVNSSGIISTIAGTGTAGYSGDGGPAVSAQLNYISSIAVDAAGNIFLADGFNQRIRKINTSGIITTIAGNGTSGFSGDGGAATAAALSHPEGISVDAAGNIFITDTDNNRIRKVNTSGIITTIAGNGVAGYTGDGIPAITAELNYPYAAKPDASGNIYIADYYNFRVRMVNTSGKICTVAGDGIQGFSGDGGIATSAEIDRVYDLAVGGSGAIYLADGNNNRIRYVSGITGLNEYANPNGVNVYPVPGDGHLTVSLTGVGYSAIEIYDVCGKAVYAKHIDPTEQDMDLQIDISSVSNGMYLMQVITEKGIIRRRIDIVGR
jgi:sugar lactone lactonase YvrE